MPTRIALLIESIIREEKAKPETSIKDATTAMLAAANADKELADWLLHHGANDIVEHYLAVPEPIETYAFLKLGLSICRAVRAGTAAWDADQWNKLQRFEAMLAEPMTVGGEMVNMADDEA